MTRLAIRGWGRVVAAGDHRHIGPIRSVWTEAPARVERVDRASALAMMVAGEALDRAARPSGDDARLGVFLGTALGCADVNDRFHRGLVAEGVSCASPRLFAQTIPSGPAGEVAIAHRALGHAITVMAGRCSGLAAIVEARRALALGRCDAALVLAGDVFGDDRAALLARDGSTTPREAMIALYVEDASRAAGPTAAIVELVEVRGDGGGGAHAGPDWLGASGLVELTRWLDAPTPTFEVDIGHAGLLRAVRETDRAPSSP